MHLVTFSMGHTGATRKSFREPLRQTDNFCPTPGVYFVMETRNYIGNHIWRSLSIIQPPASSPLTVCLWCFKQDIKLPWPSVAAYFLSQHVCLYKQNNPCVMRFPMPSSNLKILQIHHKRMNQYCTFIAIHRSVLNSESIFLGCWRT